MELPAAVRPAEPNQAGDPGRVRTIGYASYRSRAWHRRPPAGPNDVFADAADFHRLTDAVLATDTVLDSGMVYFDARRRTRGRPSKSAPPTSPSGSRTPSRSPASYAAWSRRGPRGPGGHPTAPRPRGGPAARRLALRAHR